ncbi:MAG: hypothetical protein BCS36_04040 [Desulfovibrio sp. MES5]|uniref:hypothetical protein n=1 Tax=Desulfovibrio sp. MES5 TaxID=1899016 RepID=UPI000B9CCB5F|nr:hypothetical protein [Desulfovibrio sp. MES5]OXS29946.1 MAG: hypothetical protein BCS36_04040 [Desulfovibrio sp. MES5]
MTMPYSPSRAVYEGNDAATRFPFGFKVWDASQLVVTLTSPDGATTEASGWTADIGASGGEIVYLHEDAPLPSGWKLAVTRNMPFTQEVNLVSASRFDPQVIEDALDQATAERQQTLEMMRRAVILPATSSETPQDVVLAVYAARDDAQNASSAAQSAKAAAGKSAEQAAASAAGASAAVAAAAATAVTAASAQAGRAQSAANAAEAAAEAAADNARQAVAAEIGKASSEADRAQSEANRAQIEADRAQSLSDIGPAASDKLGFVKIGEGIAITDEGVISVPPPPEINLATNVTAGTIIVGEGLRITGLVEEGQDSPPPGTLALAAHSDESGEKYGKGDSQFFGHVKLTDDFEQDADATSGISISPKGVKTAFNRLVGILDEQVITSSRTWVVPETGRYKITNVGGGGNGASGGSAAYGLWPSCYECGNVYSISSGGGGGGGGSGETTTITTTLTKGQSYSLTIGGAGGTTSFGVLLTARGGGNGSPGGSGTASSGGNYGGSGGNPGTSYGGAAGRGGNGYNANREGYWPEPVGGGGGGSGGTSTDGYYGNGGAGGAGGGQSDSGRGYLSLYGPAGGGAGRQGCIKIKIVPV